MSFTQVKLSIVSGAGVMIADAFTYPLEALSTMVKNSAQKRSAFRLGWQIFKDRQVYSLYKGFSSVPMTGFLPGMAYFYVYEGLKNWAHKKTEHWNSSAVANTIPVLASIMGELAYTSLIVPFDTIQTRMQMGDANTKYRSVSHGMSHIVSSEGLLRLFTASPIYALQFLTFTPVQFGFYEYFKTVFLPADSPVSLKNCLAFTIASTALASSVTNPLNTIIVRFQCEDHSSNNSSFREKIKTIYSNAGMTELNRGLTVRVFERTINAIVFIPIYEMTRQYLMMSKE